MLRFGTAQRRGAVHIPHIRAYLFGALRLAIPADFRTTYAKGAKISAWGTPGVKSSVQNRRQCVEVSGPVLMLMKDSSASAICTARSSASLSTSRAEAGMCVCAQRAHKRDGEREERAALHEDRFHVRRVQQRRHDGVRVVRRVTIDPILDLLGAALEEVARH